MRQPDVPPGGPLRVLLVEETPRERRDAPPARAAAGGYDPSFERVYTPEGMERALSDAEGRGEAFEVVIPDYAYPSGHVRAGRYRL